MDLQERIVSCKSLFWTGYVGSTLEVRPKLQIRLCTNYQKTKGQCTGDCEKLHICRFNLLSPRFCSGPCPNNLSHSVYSEHNTNILRAAVPIWMHNSRDLNQIQMLLRSSLPRLCSSFQDKGKCEKTYCGYLHICLDNLYGDCIGQCKVALKSNTTKSIVHDFRNGHNGIVMLNFGYLQNGEFLKEELLHNLLLPKENTSGTSVSDQYVTERADESSERYKSKDNLTGCTLFDEGILKKFVSILSMNFSTFLLFHSIRKFIALVLI